MSNFDPDATGYSSLNALWLGKAARLAYQPSSSILPSVTAWDFPKFKFFDISDTQAYMIANNDLIVLAFRGTEPSCLRDWMTDARIALIKGCGDGHVHRGFYTALDACWHDISATLKDFRTEKQPLLLTGHSLGAALATLAAARLHVDGQAVQGLYTFGSPRVGDVAFAHWFDVSLKPIAFRFVNNTDAVTRVPGRALGYSHVGNFLYFDDHGKIHNDTSFWNEFLETVKGGMDDFLKPGAKAIKDHDMGLYETNLQLNLNSVLTWKNASQSAI